MFGGGIYTLSSVMEIEGTDKYLETAENDGICQNQETEENCLTREYLNQELCSCIPYKLRNYSKVVSAKILKINDLPVIVIFKISLIWILALEV